MFRNQTFSIPRFLIVYLLLSAGFYAYIGIVSPGGKTYSPFLDQYADFPAWLTYFICQGAKGMLKLSGYDVFQRTFNTIAISGSRGVSIIWACLGFGVMSFWTAFVTAHKAGWKYKFAWVGIGIALITGINIVRIALIALANHHSWKAFQAIEPHFAFNVVSYIAIFGLMGWFAKRYKLYRMGKIKEVQLKPTEKYMV